MSDIFGIAQSVSSNPFAINEITGIRRGVERFISQHPNWMVYVRVDHKYPCGYCWEPESKSPDPTCDVCFGLGKKVQYEKVAVRRATPGREVQDPMQQFGYMSKYRLAVYSPRYYYPKAKDLYLEVEWDKDTPLIEQYGKPINVISAYQVDEVFSMKEDEVSYVVAGCDIYNFTLKNINLWVKNLGAVWVDKVVI
jgi:hypothetical protein